jgi:hypothetical protein
MGELADAITGAVPQLDPPGQRLGHLRAARRRAPRHGGGAGRGRRAVQSSCHFVHFFEPG